MLADEVAKRSDAFQGAVAALVADVEDSTS
jgi:hypothetical protein